MRFKYIPLYFSMSSADETFQLAKTVNTENYLCGIVKLSGKIPKNVITGQRLFLCSDICQDSYVNQTKFPALFEIKTKPNGSVNTDIYNISWLHILRPSTTSIRLYICNEEGAIVSFEGGSLNSSLLFVHSP